MEKQMSMKKSRRLPGMIFLLALLMTIMIPFAAFAEEFSCTVNLPVKVQIDGKNPPSLDYKFKIEAENNAPLPEVTEVTVNAAETGTVEFGPITYKRPGNYIYRITQITDNRLKLTYDSRTYAVTVQILRSEDNSFMRRSLPAQEAQTAARPARSYLRTNIADRAPAEAAVMTMMIRVLDHRVNQTVTLTALRHRSTRRALFHRLRTQRYSAKPGIPGGKFCS